MMKKQLGIFAAVLLAVCVVLSTGVVAFAADASPDGGEERTVGLAGVTEFVQDGSLTEYYSTELSFSRDVFKTASMEIIGFHVQDDPQGTYTFLTDYFTVNGKTVRTINEATDDSGYDYTTFPGVASLDVPVMLVSMAANKMTVAIHRQYVQDNGLSSNLTLGVTADFRVTVKAPADEWDEYIDATYVTGKSYTLTLDSSSGRFGCDAEFMAYEQDREMIARKYTREEMDALDYYKISAQSISTIVQVGDVREYKGESRTQVQYVVIYFDRDICNQYIPYASCRKSTLTNVAANVFLTPKQIDAFYDYHMDEYLTKNIKIDGRTLTEIRKEETDNTAIPEIVARIVYSGASSLPSSLVLYIDYNSEAWMSKDKPHTIEIMQGFRTPLMGEVKADKKFVYSPDTEEWSTASADADFAALPLKDTRAQTKKGCGSAVGSTGDLYAVCGVLLAAAGILAIRRKVAQ